MAWLYQREESEFPLIPVGTHRVRIRDVEKTQSKSGNDMLKITLDVSGQGASLFHYIVFMQDRPEITNRMLTQFFDSFKDIQEGQFNTFTWIGCVGACTVKHEEYNGSMTAKIGYFIKAEKQKDLPPWQEPKGKEPPKPVAEDQNGFMSVAPATDDDLPPF